MSHVTQIELKVKDLEALKAACQRLGFEFREGQTEFKSYYTGNECFHAIRVPGAAYEVGVIQETAGGYSLKWDSYSSGGLVPKVGQDAGKLKQAYALEAAKVAARRAGYSCFEKVEEDQTITLTMQRRG